MIDLSFLFLLLYLRDFSFFKDKSFQYLLVFYIYLIFNTLLSEDQAIGISRNLGFIRIIIFFVAINYFFKDLNFGSDPCACVTLPVDIIDTISISIG